MSIFTEFHLKFHHKFLFVFLHWYSSHSLDFTSVYDFSFATASVFERLWKTKSQVVCQFWQSFFITFSCPLQQHAFLNVCVQYKITSGMSILTKFLHNFELSFATASVFERLWNTKSQVVCQFWQSFFITLSCPLQQHPFFERLWNTKSQVVCQFWQSFFITFIRILFFS